MSKTEETANIALAINPLLKMWDVEPLSPQASPEAERNLDKIVSRRNLRIAQMTGNIGTIRRLDMPVLLELFLPGAEGKRYLSVTGQEGERLLIAPPLAGRGWLTSAELDALWGGKIYFLWKNHFDIPTRLKQGTRGKAVAKLQKLLGQAGAYKGPLNGVYDRATIDAVRSFQVSQGIGPDDTMGRRTLIFLYRETGLYPPPRLSKKGDGKAG
jgi:general secretion pathway protein A